MFYGNHREPSTWTLPDCLHDELVRHGATGCFLFASGNTVYLRNGQRHRDGSPAVICPNGLMLWYRKGRLHRQDGPAVISPKSDILKWFLNGREIRPIADDRFPKTE